MARAQRLQVKRVHVPPAASAARAFLRELSDFTYRLSGGDRVWNVIFPDRLGKWHHLSAIVYRNVRAICDVDGKRGTFEVGLRRAGSAQDDDWEPLLTAACGWLKVARRDWVKANRRVRDEYPLNRRWGIVPHAVIRSTLPAIFCLDRELGRSSSRKIIRLVEEGYFHRDENTVGSSMTAADYFKYCRIAYRAGKRKGERVNLSLSGREMYARYADGRHEGLLDIDETSEKEFADWIDGTHPKRTRGGHPWEIKRGGNTTHIDLYVARPAHRKEGFKVELCGPSITRMAETLRMFLAIRRAGLPVSLCDPEGTRKRLLGEDNVGIVPCYESLHRANQHFRQGDDVYDVLYFDDLGRQKRRIAPFITWEPMPLLRPHSIEEIRSADRKVRP